MLHEGAQTPRSKKISAFKPFQNTKIKDFIENGMSFNYLCLERHTRINGGWLYEPAPIYSCRGNKALSSGQVATETLPLTERATSIQADCPQLPDRISPE
jgi:hypothetical protein